MKKLYENIEDIDIRGDIDQLTEVVKTIDISLQNIAANTEQLTEYLTKYSASNKGSQYERIVKTSLLLRDKVFLASQELNEMQNQVVAYQNKVYRYEDMTAQAQTPNPYLVTKKQVSVDTSGTKFSLQEMLELDSVLRNYSESVSHHMKVISEKKNAIGAVWCDRQYMDFSEYIDDIMRDLIEAIRGYEAYVLYLEEKIKELR